ncbi:unnamed protein product [Pieris brassicae]|uniref:DUF7869 domain-containing protein n=1 Tax=Pieris brassicae TaxID=7116 RepID=A0A9P0SQS1_PIEBR|nr:unnamed protein product [Pieris brassicae]
MTVKKNLNLLKVPDQVAYYIRNVYLYNFTIVEGSSKTKLLPENVFAYCWAENVYPKAANEIASALYHRLKNSDLSSIETVRLVADGCAGQNKNTIMLGMLSKWLTEAPQNVKKVELVFPVVGHAYIPPDRVFAQIEKQYRYRLGTDFEVFDWKTASQEVFKPVGSWHFRFKLCKRYVLKRSKRPGRVKIEGHLYYKTDDGVLKNVCQKNKTTSMINPRKINASNKITDTLLESNNQHEDEENEDKECNLECEEYQEVDDLHV